MKKHFLSLVLVFGLAFVLVGCGKTEKPAPATTKAPVATTKAPVVTTQPGTTTTPAPTTTEHLVHTYGDAFKYDEHDHWKECTICEAPSQKAPHEFVDEVATKATDTVEGVVRHTCSVCGYSYDENIGLAYVWEVKDGEYLKDFTSLQNDPHFTISYSEDGNTAHIVSSSDWSWNAIIAYAKGDTAGYGLKITITTPADATAVAKFLVKPNNIEPSWLWNNWAPIGETKSFCYAGSDIPATMERLVLMPATADMVGDISIQWVKLDYAETATYKVDAENNKIIATYACTTEGFSKYNKTEEIAFADAKFADVDLDFEELTKGTDYTGTDWTKYQYQTSGWVELTNVQNRVRSNDDVNVLLNYAVGGNAMKYYYNEKAETPLGFANYFSFKFGNYWSSNVPIKMKFVVQDVNGTLTYLAGSASEWQELPVTGKELQKISVYLPNKAVINVQTFYLCVQASTSTYLYCDDFVVSYEATDPTVEVYDGQPVLKLDFEDGAGSGNYTSAMWVQEKYTTDWVAHTGGMNSREKGGSKVANFGGTSGATTRYTFNSTGAPIGYADHFSIKLGNYFSGAVAKIKIVLGTVGGGSIYLYGSSSEWYELEITTDMDVVLEKSFEGADIQYVRVVVGNQTGNWVYADDLTLSSSKKAAAVYAGTVATKAVSMTLLGADLASVNNGVLSSTELGLVQPMSVAVDGLTVTMKDTQTNGAYLTLVGTLASDFSTITMTSATGTFTAAAAFAEQVFTIQP